MPEYLVIFLITVSSIFTIISVFPYLVNVLKKKTKPRIVTWFIWGLITGVSCLAAFFDKQYATAIMLAFSSLTSFLIMVLGWKLGDKKIDILDYICLFGAIIGIVVWQLLDSPESAVLIMIATDFIGGLPTTVHSWKKPFEETWQTFFMGIISGVCTLIAMSNWQITSFAFPLFITLNSLNVTLIILLRRNFLKSKTR